MNEDDSKDEGNNNFPQTPTNIPDTKWIIGGVVGVAIIAFIVIMQFYAGSVKATEYGPEASEYPGGISRPINPFSPSPYYSSPPSSFPSFEPPDRPTSPPSDPPSAPPSGMPVYCPTSYGSAYSAMNAATSAYYAVISGYTPAERTACGI